MNNPVESYYKARLESLLYDRYVIYRKIMDESLEYETKRKYLKKFRELTREITILELLNSLQEK